VVAESGSTRPPGLLALHPTPPERIADLEAQAAAARPLYEKALADAASARKPAPKPKSKSTQRKSRGPRD
jgi:predicted Zn-dependent protease